MSDEQRSVPYRSGMACGLGIVLASALILAIVDIVHTGGAAIPLLALWAMLALPAAIGTGLVLGAGAATWGDGWVRGFFRKLRERPELDKTVAGVLIAGALVAGVLALGVGKLAIGLVGEVQRKDTGGKLLGVVVVGLVPILALAALPLFRVTRRIASIIPAIGPLSRVVSLVIVGVVVVAAAAAFIVTKQLDYQALNLGSLVVPALLPVVAIVLAIVVYGPLGRVRERIPARGIIAVVALVIAAVLPVVGLGNPSDDVKTAVVDRSYVGGRMVAAIRKFIDRDHDGYSPFFGGPDCDDSDPNRHLRAPDGSCLEDAKPVPVDPHPVIDAGVTVDAPSMSGGKNLLVIFIDTLRWDRLGITGYEREGKKLTPRLDQFAKQAVVFRKAFSQAPNTPRSVPSFLTSCYPSQIKWNDPKKDYGRVDDANETLFEAFKSAGYLTTGETSHFFFCDRRRYPDTCKDVVDTDYKPMDTNITQGTDEWDNTEAKNIPDSNHDIAGPRIIKKTIDKLHALASGDKKFAMLVHLFDPHSTYMEHPGFTYKEHGNAGLAEKYDYEIAFEDGLVGQLLDELDATKLSDNTTVVVLADHGEGFGLHTIAGQQDFFHGETLYQPVLHVPLMFRVPGAKPCMRDDVVQLLDLAPTVAALFDVKPSAKWVGRSLVPALQCGAMPPEPAFAELMPVKAWDHEAKSMITADGSRHVYFRISDSVTEIYDIDKDPDERTNIEKSDPDATKLEKQLVEWMKSLPKGCR